MKLSSNTIGILLFTVIASMAFVWMAKRPAVDGQTISFGMPIKATSAESKTPEAEPEPAQVSEPEKVEEVKVEAEREDFTADSKAEEEKSDNTLPESEESTTTDTDEKPKAEPAAESSN